MNRKKIARKILFPHPAFTALLAAVATVLLVYSFLRLDSMHALSIAAYGLSFYALLLICLRAPDMLRWVRRFRQGNPYYLLYKSDVRLRMNLSLYGSFAFNAAYALFQLCLGLWHRSVWFYAMSGYYLLLAAMRLMLLRYSRHYDPGEEQEIEWRKCRLCGALLMAMTLVLAVIITYFVLRIRSFRHHEITTIAMAAYTFTALGLAIRNVFRYRRYGSPAYSAAKAISLVSAAVSLLTLENAMLTAFGQESGERFLQVMLSISGIAVLLLVQGIALYMIIRAGKALRGNTKTGVK